MSKRPAAAEDLRSEVVRLADLAARKTLAGEAATDELDRIALLKRVLDVLPSPAKRTWLWAAVVAALCLTAVTVAATIRMPKTRVELQVRTNSVSWRPVAEVNWQGKWRVDSGLISFRNLARADLPPEFAAPVWTGRLSLDLAAPGGVATVNSIRASAGSMLSADRAGGLMFITAAKAAIRMELNVSGRAVVSGGDDAAGSVWRSGSVSFGDPPGLVAVGGPGQGEVPVTVRLLPIGALEVPDVEVKELGFLQEHQEQEHPLLKPINASAVLAGSLVLTDTHRKIALENGAIFRLGISRGVMTLIRFAPDGIFLKFEGSVNRITLGRGEFAQDLRPTLMEFLFHQQKVGFAWSALVILWGLLWSARSLLLEK
jgi:hypothetical protein